MKKFTVVMLSTLVLAGCGGGEKKPPYKTLPKPMLPAGVKAPNCPGGDNHSMGQCLPSKSGSLKPELLKLPSGITCVDLSNNDPVYGIAAWKTIRSRGIRCAMFKVNEGTGFVDRTAAAMASSAKAAGVLVGGYDFQHVCGVSAASEAHVFSVYLREDGLLGSNTVAPAADAESGNGLCGGHSWELSWRAEVRRETGRDPQTYTGSWWWNPNMGTFDPGGYKWVSGYGVSWPFMPAGWHLDQWQWTDAGYNGVTHADMSLFLDGEAAFRTFTAQSNPVVLPVCFHKRESASQCAGVKKQIAGWQKAVTSSEGAYKARSCPVLAQRVSWFGNAIKHHPKDHRTASRKRALAASQRAYRRNSCGVFAGRVSYFSSRIWKAQASN